MKTDFLILWVDDNKLVIDSLASNLGKWLEEKGFELRVIPHKDETNVLTDIKTYDVELIVIDYKLPKKNGNEIIKDIRASGCYQDIVFYSEGVPPKEPFDGVFFVSKEDAKTRIKELVDLKLLRSFDPMGIRGWVVADAIELEGMVNELLIRCYSHRDGFNFTDRLFYSDSNPLEFGTKVGMLNGIMKDRIALLRANGVKDGSVEKLDACKTIFDTFQKEVVEIRNIVAHQRMEATEKGKAIKRKSTNVLDEATIVLIRKNLRKHRDNLINLQSVI